MTEPQIPPIISLHRYWVTADAIRERMRLDVPNKDGGSMSRMPPELVDAAQWLSRVSALTVFYGLLYVVIDGYQELSLSDEAVDGLLRQGDYVDLLRRFRNVVFHFQRDPFDKRLIEFLDVAESDSWMNEVYKVSLPRFSGHLD